MEDMCVRILGSEDTRGFASGTCGGNLPDYASTPCPDINCTDDWDFDDVPIDSKSTFILSSSRD